MSPEWLIKQSEISTSLEFLQYKWNFQFNYAWNIVTFIRCSYHQYDFFFKSKEKAHISVI